MTITLPSDLQEIIQERIAEGPYRDADEVVRVALERLEDEERLRWLRQALAEAEEDEVVEFTPELRDTLYRSAIERANADKAAVAR